MWIAAPAVGDVGAAGSCIARSYPAVQQTHSWKKQSLESLVAQESRTVGGWELDDAALASETLPLDAKQTTHISFVFCECGPSPVQTYRWLIARRRQTRRLNFCDTSGSTLFDAVDLEAALCDGCRGRRPR